MQQRTFAEVVLTEATCGDACWRAREDVCRCSCGGKNHGCLRSENGVQPPRTRRIKGAMYQLIAVEAPNGSCRAETMRPMEQQLRDIDRRAIDAGLFQWHELMGCKSYLNKPVPAVLKTASADEVKRWPELAGWRDRFVGPLTLWLRPDLLHLQ